MYITIRLFIKRGKKKKKVNNISKLQNKYYTYIIYPFVFLDKKKVT